MNIRFSGKNFKVTDGIKEHLEEKLVKFEKYAPRLVGTHVVFIKEKYLYKVEITLSAKNLRVYGEGKAKDNIYAAIDMAYSRVEKQLKKFREKLKGHSKSRSGRKTVPLDLTESVNYVSSKLSEQSGDATEIIKSDSFAPKPMVTEEASMQLKLSGDPFVVFQNAETGKVNVIYKRKDGRHGLVEPN